MITERGQIAMPSNPCNAQLLSEAAAYADLLSAQGVARSKALQHARHRFGFTTKQIMSASGRKRIDPHGEIDRIRYEFARDTQVTIDLRPTAVA